MCCFCWEMEKCPKWSFVVNSPKRGVGGGFTRRGCPTWRCPSSSCCSCAPCGCRCCSSGAPPSGRTPRRTPSGRSRRWRTCRRTASAAGSSVSAGRSGPGHQRQHKGREEDGNSAWRSERSHSPYLVLHSGETHLPVEEAEYCRNQETLHVRGGGGVKSLRKHISCRITCLNLRPLLTW